MIQRILNSKGLLTYLAAAATWLALYLRAPFPEENLFLRLIAMRTPVVFQGLKCSYLPVVFEAIRELMQPVTVPRKRRLGFSTPEE